MAYKLQFDNGHTVEFESQPSEADIDEAYTHTKTLPAKSQEASLLSKAWPHVNAGVEALANTAAGALGSLTTGPLAAATNLVNTAVREGRLAPPEELGKAFNEGVGILTGGLEEATSPLGKEYTNKIGQVFNDVGIPAMAHIGVAPLPSMGQIGTQLKSMRDIPVAFR